jgi:quinol monooxygenase YgiN
MPIKVVVEFRARPGARAELKDVLEGISATYGPTAAGFLGSTVYETIDDVEGLVEIANWESAEAQAAAVQRAAETGVYAPLADLLGAPIKATRIG